MAKSPSTIPDSLRLAAEAAWFLQALNTLYINPLISFLPTLFFLFFFFFLSRVFLPAVTVLQRVTNLSLNDGRYHHNEDRVWSTEYMQSDQKHLSIQYSPTRPRSFLSCLGLVLFHSFMLPFAGLNRWMNIRESGGPSVCEKKIAVQRALLIMRTSNASRNVKRIFYASR